MNLGSSAELHQLKQALHTLLFRSCHMVCVVMVHLLSAKQQQSKQGNSEITEQVSRASQIIYMNPLITGTWIVISETLHTLTQQLIETNLFCCHLQTQEK